MDRKFCRYSASQLESLGYDPSSQDHVPAVVSRTSMNDIARGMIGEIIDVLYTSKDGRLDNALQSLVTENAPESVRSFVNNVLLCDVKALQSAPDDETAFRCLIPRHACTPSELKPYLADIGNFIAEHRKSQNSQS